MSDLRGIATYIDSDFHVFTLGIYKREDYSPENIVAKNMYAAFGFEEVPEASDLEEDEINAVLRI